MLAPHELQRDIPTIRRHSNRRSNLYYSWPFFDNLKCLAESNQARLVVATNFASSSQCKSFGWYSLCSFVGWLLVMVHLQGPFARLRPGRSNPGDDVLAVKPFSK